MRHLVEGACGLGGAVAGAVLCGGASCLLFWPDPVQADLVTAIGLLSTTCLGALAGGVLGALSGRLLVGFLLGAFIGSVMPVAAAILFIPSLGRDMWVSENPFDGLFSSIGLLAHNAPAPGPTGQALATYLASMFLVGCSVSALGGGTFATYGVWQLQRVRESLME